MKIIFKNSDDSIGVIHPTESVLASMTIEEIAQKDVPTGRPYAIVEDDIILADRTYREAWTIDDSLLTAISGESA